MAIGTAVTIGSARIHRLYGRWPANQRSSAWKSWAYGEVPRFYTVIDGDQVRWFNAEGQLADDTVIARAPAAR